MALFLCFEMALQVSPGVMAKNLMQDLDISTLGLGLMSGCYFITYAIMQIPSGLMYDRANFRILVTAAILLCSIGTLLFGCINSLLLGIIARLFMGFGSAFAFLAVLTVAARYFPAKYFAMLTGFAQLLAAVGGMGGNLPIAWLVDHFGWRETLWSLATIGFILASLVWCVVRKPRHPLNDHTPSLPVSTALKTIITNPQTWTVAAYAFCNWAPVTAFSALWGVPFLMAAHGFDVTTASLLIALTWLGIGIASPIIGGLSDHFGRRKPLLVLCSLVGLIGISLVIYWPTAPMPCLILFLLLAGMGSSGQILSFAVIKDFTPATHNTTAIGFNNMAVVASGFLVQPFIGHMLNRNQTLPHLANASTSLSLYQSALWLLPLFFGLCILISAFLIQETYCQKLHTR